MSAKRCFGLICFRICFTIHYTENSCKGKVQPDLNVISHAGQIISMLLVFCSVYASAKRDSEEEKFY